VSREHLPGDLPARISTDAPVAVGSAPSLAAPHGPDHRRAQQHTERCRPRFQHPMLTIHERPFPPDDRSQAGHWEGDLIVGKDQASAIGTLIERQTRIVRLLHLPRRHVEALQDALTAQLADLPPARRRSITWDQGTAMTSHLEISRSLGAPVYFCDNTRPGSAARTRI
jgi:transposase, IS30 family